jgi:hypothetical protein
VIREAAKAVAAHETLEQFLVSDETPAVPVWTATDEEGE